nr:hypothetical protein [Paramagnetospirillum marisnigri]
MLAPLGHIAQERSFGIDDTFSGGGPFAPRRTHGHPAQVTPHARQIYLPFQKMGNSQQILLIGLLYRRAQRANP